MKEFSQNFASKKDLRLYLLSIKKQGNHTAYNVMVKDRASKLPSELLETIYYTRLRRTTRILPA